MTSEESKPAADTVNPFLTKEVVCPVCEKKSPQRRVKGHLFVEKNRDVDLRPLAYQRSKPGLELVHPLVYYLWHCPHCRFTAWPGAYENPVKTLPLTIGKYRAVLLEPPGREKAAGRVWERLALGVEAPDLDFFLGVKRHLLAIFQLLLVQSLTGVRDTMNLGRYYLRLAWLYRELDEQPSLQPYAAQVRVLLQELKADWPKAPADAEAAASQAALEYEAVVSTSGAMESAGEVCNLLLLITRIHIRLRRSEPARAVWSKAHELVRGVDNAKRSLEDQYSRLQDQARSSTKVVADAAKSAMPEISAKIVETDALARGMRNKVQEVRNLIHDLDEDLDAGKPQGDDPEDKPPPKKKFFGLFK
jgi:uncharacterized protein (DUF2225 family)